MLLTSRPSHNEHTVGLSTLPTIKTWNMEAIKYIPSKWVCYTIMDATHRFFTRSPEMESENIGNRLYSRVKPYIRAKFHGKWCSGNWKHQRRSLLPKDELVKFSEGSNTSYQPNQTKNAYLNRESRMTRQKIQKTQLFDCFGIRKSVCIGCFLLTLTEKMWNKRLGKLILLIRIYQWWYIYIYICEYKMIHIIKVIFFKGYICIKYNQI